MRNYLLTKGLIVMMVLLSFPLMGWTQTLTLNYKDAPVKTNEAGVAHFKLKSPDDFAPSSVGADDMITVYFAVFNAQEECLAFEPLKVNTGEKNKPLTLELKEPND